MYTRREQRNTQCMQTLPLKDTDFSNERSLYAAYSWNASLRNIVNQSNLIQTLCSGSFVPFG